MIELAVTFLAGFVYAVLGMATEKYVRDAIDDALLVQGIGSSLWGSYVALMVIALWPVLAFLIVLTTGYATLSEVSE